MIEVDRIHCGDCLEVLQSFPDESVDCCVTSPPYYGLRDYGIDGQIGLEPSPDEYVAKLVEAFREVRRVLKKEGSLWLNLGDSYASMGRSGRDESPGVGAKQEISPIHTKVKWHAGDGSKFQWRIPAFDSFLKPKDLIGIPWRVAFALQADGWWLRSDIIWAKGNPMPESVTDRPTKAHEFVFLLTKSARYYYDNEAVKEGSVTNDPRRPYTSKGAWDLDGRPKETRHSGEPRLNGDFTKRNRRSVWTIKSTGNREKECLYILSSDLSPIDKLASIKEMLSGKQSDVWRINTKPFSAAHFAVMPEALVEPCILAGCPEGGIVLDPFFGAGTVGAVAQRLCRHWIGIDINPGYNEMAKQRIAAVPVNLSRFAGVGI